MKICHLKYKELLPGDFSIKHKIAEQADRNDFHIHDACEIVLILSDNVKCAVGDKNYILAPNTILLFNNMDLHRLSLYRPGIYDRYVIYFVPEYIQSFSSKETDLLEAFFFRPFPDPQIVSLEPKQAEHFQALLDKICAYQSDDSGKLYGRDLHVKFLLGELLLFVNGVYRKHHNITSNSIASGNSLIYSLINYIHRNLSEDLSLEKLASTFFINKYYLCELFNNVTGTSPNQYIIGCRIMKAKELLSLNLSVETVCDQVGYNNLSHFSRSFKQRTGVSPKKFSLSHHRTGAK